MPSKVKISLPEVRSAKNNLDAIRHHLKKNNISFGEAKTLALPYLKILNAYAESRANDFGVRHKMINFTSFMR